MKLHLNITVKLIAYLVVISVLPLIVFAATSYDLVRHAIIGVAGQYSAQLVANQRDYLQLQMEQVERLASSIASIEDISAVAVKTDAAAGAHNPYDELATQAAIRQSLNTYAASKGIVSIDMYTAGGSRFYVGDTLTIAPVDEATRLRLYRAGVASAAPLRWLGVEDNLNGASTSRKVLTAQKIIQRYVPQLRASQPVGMLLIDYSTAVLADHFSQVDLGHDAYLLVADGAGRLIYAPDRARIGTAMPPELRALAGRAGSVDLWLDSRQALVSTACLAGGRWCVFGVIPQQTLLAPMRRLTQIAAALMLVCFVVIALASRLFQRAMVDPIKAISDGFRRIQARAQVLPLPLPDTEDEIRELLAWFNAFLATLAAQQRYEEELVESERKFSSIFQLTPIPLGLVRISDGLFVDVNDFWLTQFEYAREEVIGHTSVEFNMWDDPRDRARMLEQLKEHQVVLRLEANHRTRSGRVLTCLLSGRPFEFRGQMTLIFSIIDITRQRQIEQEIREANQQLESRVRSRTVKLEQANEELADAMASLTRTKNELVRSEKMAALGSLVAGIAHELNTPIGNSVTVASTLHELTREMLAAMAGGGVKRSAVIDYFDAVDKGSEILGRNLSSASELITTFKQVAADQASSQRRRFDLKETLEGVVATLLPMYKKSGHVLRFEVPAGIWMDSYPGPLGQVVTNFVTNALAHAFQGRDGGTMTLSARRLDGGAVEIAFRDDGAGIPEQHQPRVFDPFFTTRLGQGGSGLGLNIVYNIVTGLLGGTIRLESTVGGGTVFTIVLPLSASVAGA
ncbi:ATP-binding protein [Rugamonas sp.]|uniref:sensor histidine kinase n=1 Tax=Rugamonas sp. TaxID=1926287 RepID=UPI0025EC25AF|nr:ATP-binding protein [Rugamonas sp.]